MTGKLLRCFDEPVSPGQPCSLAVDQVALTLPAAIGLGDALVQVDRSSLLDLLVVYESYCTRLVPPRPEESQLIVELKRLGAIRGKPGIGHPAAVHLERCAAPARVVATDSPSMAMLGGLGVLTLVVAKEQLAEAIATGRIDWTVPQVIQVVLSGRLSASVSARDAGLEFARLGLPQRIRALNGSGNCPVVIEFSGPGVRSLPVQERALLCASAVEMGATSAISTSDEKTDQFLRDQRRSKAFRQLVPDAGAPCAEVLCVDLLTIQPLISLGAEGIVPVSDVANRPIGEVIVGGEASASLRDLLNLAAWCKTKRISGDVDVIVIPATRQIFEAITSNGALSQLLSVGVRLLEPDVRLVDGTWQAPASPLTSLRSFPARNDDPRCQTAWAVASIDTLCSSAITGSLQDPRALRKAPRIASPRELPIDDSLLFDRKPSTSTTLLPPSMTADAANSLVGDYPPICNPAQESRTARQRVADIAAEQPI